MEEQEKLLQVARRVRLLRRVLFILFPISILGTYLALNYSHLLANGPVIIQSYADPVLASFLIWSFYGLVLVLLAYYSRLRKLLTTKQVIFLAVIFIIYPILSYVYILGLWVLNRPHEMVEEGPGEGREPESVVTNGSEN